MTDPTFRVTASAGSLLPDAEPLAQLPHAWTNVGIAVDTTDGIVTGAHLLHLSVAGCVLNDVYREAAKRELTIDGVRVEASGGFDDEWSSTGISYAVEVESPGGLRAVEELLQHVSEVAEIPKTVRAGAAVRRSDP